MPPRSFKGTCALCSARIDRRHGRVHFDACAPAHDLEAGPPAELVTFRISALGARVYWLDVEAAAGARLSKLDGFLRDTWLECCGHLSMFSIPPFRYASSIDTFGFGRAGTERSMQVKIGEAFSRTGVKGTYDYDFGSTTRLAVERTGGRIGRIARSAVRLLARNDPPIVQTQARKAFRPGRSTDCSAFRRKLQKWVEKNPVLSVSVETLREIAKVIVAGC
jgi:hypothetical protein